MIDTKKEGISIIAGEEDLAQSDFSTELNNINEYTPQDISNQLKQLPQITIRNDGEPEWWDWKAIYQEADVSLHLSMTIYEMEKEVFCSIDFQGLCPASTLIKITQYLKQNGFPNLWLHNKETKIFTLEGFEQKYGEQL